MKTKFISLFCFSVLAFHLFMTAIYLGPANLLQLRFGVLSFRYMETFFYQNWHLFSPDPGYTTTKFAVRCAGNDGQWSSWKDPFAGALQHHQWSRLTGYGKVLMLFDDIAQSLKRDELAKAKSCAQGTCPKIGETKNKLEESVNHLATRFAKDYCLSKHPERPQHLTAIQFKIIEFSPATFSVYQERGQTWDKVLDLPFDPVQIKEFDRRAI